jgi:hypothetical protein
MKVRRLTFLANPVHKEIHTLLASIFWPLELKPREESLVPLLDGIRDDW